MKMTNLVFCNRGFLDQPSVLKDPCTYWELFKCSRLGLGCVPTQWVYKEAALQARDSVSVDRSTSYLQGLCPIVLLTVMKN